MAINWDELKAEYVTGRGSYRRLADVHGIALSSVGRRAKADGWREARKQYRHRVATRVEESLAIREGETEVERLEALQAAAMDAMALLASIPLDEEQFKRHLVSVRTNGVGSEVVERIYSKIDMDAVRSYIAALRDLTATVRDLFGMPHVRDQATIEATTARAEAARAKALPSDDGNSELGIALLAEVLPLEEAAPLEG